MFVFSYCATNLIKCLCFPYSSLLVSLKREKEREDQESNQCEALEYSQQSPHAHLKKKKEKHLWMM